MKIFTYKTLRNIDDSFQTIYLNLNRSNPFELFQNDLVGYTNLTNKEMLKIYSKMKNPDIVLLKYKHIQVIKIGGK